MLITENLESELLPYLSKADEFWCAMALVKEEAYHLVQRSVPSHCRQHYVVGIDLPTMPTVLRDMQRRERPLEFECAIYQAAHNFHPKVFLIRTEGVYVAFVGSSNLTGGGLRHNIEMNIKVYDQQECEKILRWFNLLYASGFPLSHENLVAYENKFTLIQNDLDSARQRRKEILLRRKPITEASLDQIDFSDRYFSKAHHWAFRPAIWTSDEKSAIQERQAVKDRMTELHHTIYPQFSDFGLSLLKPNPAADHLLSMIRQIDPSKPRALDAMWLSYGKTESEIKLYQSLVGSDQKAKQTFIHHARLQIRIELKQIGIGLLFAKENEGGIFDRDYFSKQMQNERYRFTFYSMLKALPDSYFIDVAGKKVNCQVFTSPQDLHAHCLKDNLKKYFIIGRDYDIGDAAMSETNLPDATLHVFKLLFPFYQMMRHRF